MKAKDLEHLYTYARGLCRNLPDIYRDDIVQEAVLEAWKVAEKHAYATTGLWHKTVYMASRQARKAYQRRFRPSVELGEEMLTTGPVTLYGSLPVPEEHQVLVRKMVENDFNVAATARALGKAYSVVKRRWQGICLQLRRELQV